jgi:hypothetical protein
MLILLNFDEFFSANTSCASSSSVISQSVQKQFDRTILVPGKKTTGSNVLYQHAEQKCAA